MMRVDVDCIETRSTCCVDPVWRRLTRKRFNGEIDVMDMSDRDYMVDRLSIYPARRGFYLAPHYSDRNTFQAWIRCEHAIHAASLCGERNSHLGRRKQPDELTGSKRRAPPNRGSTGGNQQRDNTAKTMEFFNHPTAFIPPVREISGHFTSPMIGLGNYLASPHFRAPSCGIEYGMPRLPRCIIRTRNFG
jgi:hypothetical protein